MAAPPPPPAAGSQADDYLKRPLYAFDLPRDLLSTLTVKGSSQDLAVPSSETQVDDVPSAEDAKFKDLTKEPDPTSGMSCTLCGVKSKTIQEQRSHARSDVHRFNMKRKIRKQPPVSEMEFEKMIEGLSESISGSESSSTEEEGQTSDPLASLLRKKATLKSAEEVEESTARKPRSPIIWLSSPKLPQFTYLGVYRAILPAGTEENGVPEILNTLQTTPTPAPPTASDPHIFLCMIGGGHFAAMIVSLYPKLTKRNGVIEREAVVLAHKTFHRYTTRRKQGGSQSANDNSKGTAHSAGSSLRRYNEAALTADVRELLSNWKDMIDSSALLFIRATGTGNRRTLFSYDNPVIRSNNPKIRGFPFSTRRATQSELMRCFVELTRVKVSYIDESAIAAAAAAEASPSTSTTTMAGPVAKPKPSKEEALKIQHTTTLTTLLRRSKAPAITTYLNSNKLPFNFYLTPENHHTPTLLHLAAAQSHPLIVLALLTKSKEPADPGVKNSAGKTAYDLAGDKATREVFRVARQELGGDRFDWDGMGIGAPLARKAYDEVLEKEKSSKDAEEKERREKETARLKSLPEATAKASSSAGRSLSEVLGTNAATSAREEQTKGLSDEAKRRLEREQRARAAEERMKRLAGK
ncbi:hypothetical protein H072_8511 [Dactylellina haptotyla CBS 200.50]|uniref:VLRF1 domain-containing protein n=1 Tax=Dactylellina haptotyla (strain CBS 200.50) TaxID=1284197 RepID=S8A4A0_DACHA|nr:hypothetical protein H072_8511 [Dactylellina haptotyla CBS 200.50]